MGPELQLQMIAYRSAELRGEADNQRLVREAQETRKVRPDGKPRRGLLARIIPA